MLIGIGILAFAVHPAMHSLGVITLLGMSVVLLMALTVPPLLFRLYRLRFSQMTSMIRRMLSRLEPLLMEPAVEMFTPP